MYPVWKISPLQFKNVGDRKSELIWERGRRKAKKFCTARKGTFLLFSMVDKVLVKYFWLIHRAAVECQDRWLTREWSDHELVVFRIEVTETEQRTMTEKHRALPRIKIPSFRRNSSDPTPEESSEGDESSGIEAVTKGRKVSQIWDHLYRRCFSCGAGRLICIIVETKGNPLEPKLNILDAAGKWKIGCQ